MDNIQDLEDQKELYEGIFDDPKDLTQNVVIRAEFGELYIDIGYIFLPTNQQKITKICGGKFPLKQQRLYYIPTSSKINSDDYKIIKVPSNIASKFNIRYVKDGFICVEPIVQNAFLHNNEVLCYLIN